MVTSSRPSPRALTLIELLAALVILSSVVAAGASILRDAAGAARRAEAHSAALAALDRWRADTLRDGEVGADAWAFRDAAGREWRVRMEADEPAPPARSVDGAGRDPTRVDMEWLTIVVELITPAGRPEVILERRRLVEFPEESEEPAHRASKLPASKEAR